MRKWIRINLFQPKFQNTVTSKSMPKLHASKCPTIIFFFFKGYCNTNHTTNTLNRKDNQIHHTPTYESLTQNHLLTLNIPSPSTILARQSTTQQGSTHQFEQLNHALLILALITTQDFTYTSAKFSRTSHFSIFKNDIIHMFLYWPYYDNPYYVFHIRSFPSSPTTE